MATNDTTDNMIISPGSAVMDLSTNSQEEEAYSKQMLKENVNDIDKDDHNNRQLISEYVKEIYAYLRQLGSEVCYLLLPCFILLPTTYKLV